MEAYQLKQVRKEILKGGTLKTLILQLLKANPMHGYQIITCIRKNFGAYFGPSTIYPLLNSLEKKGYIKSQWQIVNGRPRKLYRLTVAGQVFLAALTAELRQIASAIAST